MSSDYRPITRTEVDAMMAHILGSEEIIQKAVEYLRPTDFRLPEEQLQHITFVTLADYYKSYHVLPTYEQTYQLVMGRTAEGAHPEIKYSPLFQDVQFHQALWAYLWQISQLKGQAIPAYAFKLMESFVFDRRTRAKIVQLPTDQLTPDMIQTIATEQTANRITTGSIVRPFEQDMFGVEPREQIGLLFLDTMLGGGVRRSEVYGFIAPSGGGKTTLTNQIGIAYALTGKHFVIFQYEESPAKNEFVIPVYACAAKIDRGVIEKCRSVNDLPPVDRERYLEVKAKIGKYLHFVDMSNTITPGGMGGVPELESYLMKFKAAGIEVAGFAVDWLIPMAKRCYEHRAQAHKGGKIDERSHFNSVVDEIKQVAGRYNCWCWIANQVAAAEAKSKKEMEWNNSAEFKSMAWLMHGCFTLNDLDDSNIGTIKLSKGRSQKRAQKCHVQLIGEMAYFKPLDGDMVYDERQGAWVKKGQENVIPQEAVKPQSPVLKDARVAGMEAGAAEY